MKEHLSRQGVVNLLEEHRVRPDVILLAVQQVIRWGMYELLSGDKSKLIKLRYYRQPDNYFTASVTRRT